MKDLEVGYILKSFPVQSQTFVLNELRMARALGVPCEIFSVFPPSQELVRHKAADSLTDSVIYCWQVRLSRHNVMRANLALLARAGPWSYLSAYRLSKEAEFLSDIRSFMRFAYWAYYLRSQGVNHLHAHFGTEGATVARIFAMLARLPFSVTLHAYDIFLDPPRDLGDKLREATFVVTVSQFNKAHLLKTYPGITPDKIHIIHPWVDLQQFSPERDTNREGRLRILSVGRLVEKKGHLYLVRACQLLRAQGLDFECRIVGDGPLHSELAAAIAQYGLQDQVHLLGALPHEEVQSLLNWCTVFVLPCVVARDGDRDGMPVSIAEAMAMEVPVISTELVGIPELVRPGAGFLVPPRDAEVLADALRQMNEIGEAKRRAMGQRGRDIVAADFDLEKGVGELIGLFRQSAEADSGVKRSIRASGLVPPTNNSTTGVQR